MVPPRRRPDELEAAVSAEPKPTAERRWSGAELAALIAVVWFMAFVLYAVLTVHP